jgi:hypothetical protein
VVAHTPGPWEATKVPTQIGHAWKFDPVGGCLYVDDRGVERRDPETAEANARLIAAAPALYEALEKALTWEGRLNRAEQMGMQTRGSRAEALAIQDIVNAEVRAARAALSAARPAPTEGDS